MLSFSMLAALALALASQTGAAREVELCCAPRVGSTLVKCFEWDLQLWLEDGTWTVSWDGDWGEPWSLDEAFLAERRIIHFEDQDLRASGWEPASSRRRFRQLFAERVEAGVRTAGRSPIERESLLFIDPGAVPSFGGSSLAPPDLLLGLESDTDLRACLPPAKVTTGAQWKVDAGILRCILGPGGRVPFVDDRDEPWRGLLDLHLGALRGELTATFVGTEGVDGLRIAIIELHGKLAAAPEPTESSGEMPVGLGYTVEGTTRESTSIVFDIAGEVAWDLETCHLLTCDLEAEVALEQLLQGRSTVITERLVETQVEALWKGMLRCRVRFCERRGTR